MRSSGQRLGDRQDRFDPCIEPRNRVLVTPPVRHREYRRWRAVRCRLEPGRAFKRYRFDGEPGNLGRGRYPGRTEGYLICIRSLSPPSAHMPRCDPRATDGQIRHLNRPHFAYAPGSKIPRDASHKGTINQSSRVLVVRCVLEVKVTTSVGSPDWTAGGLQSVGGTLMTTAAHPHRPCVSFVKILDLPLTLT